MPVCVEEPRGAGQYLAPGPPAAPPRPRLACTESGPSWVKGPVSFQKEGASVPLWAGWGKGGGRASGHVGVIREMAPSWSPRGVDRGVSLLSV